MLIVLSKRNLNNTLSRYSFTNPFSISYGYKRTTNGLGSYFPNWRFECFNFNIINWLPNAIEFKHEYRVFKLMLRSINDTTTISVLFYRN